MYYMQEDISYVKQPVYATPDLLKAMAIVNIFETGEPFGDFAACVVLDDGAGISYGISQFTHRSGSLLEVVERYLASESRVGRDQLENSLTFLRETNSSALKTLAGDFRFRNALKAAAATHGMREAQLHVAFERYLKPAVDACVGSGFVLPLSLAVIYDSITHGSYERFRDNVRVTPLGVPSRVRMAEAVALTFEKAWITEYARQRDRWLRSVPRLRTTSYRTRFFLDQITIGRWQLELPVIVHGFRLEDHHIRNLTAYAEGFSKTDTAVGPYFDPHKNNSNSQTAPNFPQDPASTPQAQPPVQSTSFSLPSFADQPVEACTLNPLNEVESHLNCAAAKFDQVDRIVTGVVTRTDRAKSLWTTVLGTLWQSAWALFGIISGLPREVWLVVAVIAALFMLFYLYRQIALGILREREQHRRHTSAS